MRIGRWLYHHDQYKKQSPIFQVKKAAVRITAWLPDGIEPAIQILIGDNPDDPSAYWVDWRMNGAAVTLGNPYATQLVVANAGWYRLEIDDLATSGQPAFVWAEDEEGTLDDKVLPVHIVRPSCGGSVGPQPPTITDPILTTCAEFQGLATSGQLVPSQWYGITDVSPTIDAGQIFYVQAVEPNTVPEEGYLFAPNLFGDRLYPATIVAFPCRLVRIYDPVRNNTFIGYTTIETWNWRNTISENNVFNNVRFRMNERSHLIDNYFHSATLTAITVKVSGSTIRDSQVDLIEGTFENLDIAGSIVTFESATVYGFVSRRDISIYCGKGSIEHWRSTGSTASLMAVAATDVELRSSSFTASSTKVVSLSLQWSQVSLTPYVSPQMFTALGAIFTATHNPVVGTGATYYNIDLKDCVIRVTSPSTPVNVSCRDWYMRQANVSIDDIIGSPRQPPSLNSLFVDGSSIYVRGPYLLGSCRFDRSAVFQVSLNTPTLPFRGFYANNFTLRDSAFTYYYTRSGTLSWWLYLDRGAVEDGSNIIWRDGDLVMYRAYLASTQVITYGSVNILDLRLDDSRFERSLVGVLNATRDMRLEIRSSMFDTGRVTVWGGGSHTMYELDMNGGSIMLLDSDRSNIGRCRLSHSQFTLNYTTGVRITYVDAKPRSGMTIFGPSHIVFRVVLGGELNIRNTLPGNQVYMSVSEVTIGPGVTMYLEGQNTTTAGPGVLRDSEFYGSGVYNITFTNPVNAGGLYAHGDEPTPVNVTYATNTSYAPHRNF